MAETRHGVQRMQFRSGLIFPGASPNGHEGDPIAAVAFAKGGNDSLFAIDRTGEEATMDVVVDELSESFSSAFVRALLSGWELSEFDRRFEEAKVGGWAAVERAEMTDLSDEWRDLGDKLGFEGVLKDLAVIMEESDWASGDYKPLVDRVRDVVGGLGSAGHPHAAIAVVSSGLPHSIQDEIFRAGAQVLDVPEDFYALDTESRRSFLKSLFPQVDEPMPDPAPGIKDPDADPSRYVARNPELSEQDVADWWQRLGAPSGKG